MERAQFLELQLESHLPHVIPVFGHLRPHFGDVAIQLLQGGLKQCQTWCPMDVVPFVLMRLLLLHNVSVHFLYFFSNEISKRVGEKWSDWSDIVHTFVAHLPRVG